MRLIGHISPSAESSTQICFQRGFINRFDLHQQDLDDDDDDDDEDDDDDGDVVGRKPTFLLLTDLHSVVESARNLA